MRVFIVVILFLLQHYILDVLEGEKVSWLLAHRSMDKKRPKEEKYVDHLEIQDIKLDVTIGWYRRCPT